MNQDIITFGTGKLAATPVSDFNGNPIANAQPVVFTQLQDVSVDFSFEEKMLYGHGQFPLGVGRGSGKITGNCKTATVNALMYSNLFFGAAATPGVRAVSEDNMGTIPASSPYTLTPTIPAAGTYVEDLGIFNMLTGTILQKVTGTPTAGQYALNASTGVYTFAAADTGIPVIYNYAYTATSANASYIPITNKAMGNMPFFSATLNSTYQGAGVVLHLNRCASNKFSLPHKNDDFSVPDFDFSAFADPAGNIGYLAFSQ